MIQKKTKENGLINLGDIVEQKEILDTNDKTFEKLMFIYSIAIKELKNKIEIIKDEFKILYNYELIDHIDSRIKEPQSILNKMENRNLKLTYHNMIENINDIAGIRIICPLKKDIFTIKELIQNINGIHILKEKDYVTYPKKSGYSSYHLILELPVILSKSKMYVKLELQIRTIAMDFWANLEHKIKYKPENEINEKESKEWIKCAKLVRKLDNKIMLLN